MNTQAGCGALCPSFQSPCIGCFGLLGRTGSFEEQMLRVLAPMLPRSDLDAHERFARAGLPDPAARLHDLALAQQELHARVVRWHASGGAPRGRRQPVLRPVGQAGIAPQ